MKKVLIVMILSAVAGALLLSSCNRVPPLVDSAIPTARPETVSTIKTASPQQNPDPEPIAVPDVPESSSTDAPIVSAAPQVTESASAEPLQTSLPQATPAPEENRSAPGIPTITRLNSFSFADNDIVPVDLNYDGISETVSIVQGDQIDTMKLVIDDTEINIEASSLGCAYVTDFCFGDNSAELVISYQKPDGEYETAVVGSFTGTTPVSFKTFPGWLESLTADKMRLCRIANVLGERCISRLHTYDSASGSFIPLEREWEVYSYDQYAKLNSELHSTVFLDDGENELVLEPGTRLIPTATDFLSYIEFETDFGAKGRIAVNNSNGACFIYDGIDLDSFFDELPQL